MDDLAEITITRTDYAGIPNEWRVKTENPPHSTTHRDIDDALLMVRVIMQRIQDEQVQR